MKTIIALALFLSVTSHADEGYVLNPYKTCDSDSYVTFDMEWCSPNALKTSPIVEVCKGSATAFERTYSVIQIKTRTSDGQIRPECLFSYEKIAREKSGVPKCLSVTAKYYISAYSPLPRTEILECTTATKSVPSLIGRSTGGDEFLVE